MKAKTLFLLAAFISLGIKTIAQISFSCHYREYCYWNDYTEEFGNCEGYEEPSLFVVNGNETMFTHTIESLKSTYYVQEKEYNSENEVWLYTVTSDVGNEYIYVFDPKNKEIRTMYTRDGRTILLRFYVKAIF